MPIGFRRELANVRNAQLKLAREVARLEDMELDVTRELSDAMRALATNQRIMHSAFSRWKDTTIEEDHFLELRDAGVETLDIGAGIPASAGPGRVAFTPPSANTTRSSPSSIAAKVRFFPTTESVLPKARGLAKPTWMPVNTPVGEEQVARSITAGRGHKSSAAAKIRQRPTTSDTSREQHRLSSPTVCTIRKIQWIRGCRSWTAKSSKHRTMHPEKSLSRSSRIPCRIDRWLLRAADPVRNVIRDKSINRPA